MNKTTNGGFYYPTDSSYIDNTDIRKLAYAKYKELCKTHPYVAIIVSSHWCTQGYWVETKPARHDRMDTVIQEHRKVFLMVRWDHVNNVQVIELWNQKEIILTHNIFNLQPLYGFKIKSIKQKR